MALSGGRDGDICRESVYLKQLVISNKTKTLGKIEKQGTGTGSGDVQTEYPRSKQKYRNNKHE